MKRITPIALLLISFSSVFSQVDSLRNYEYLTVHAKVFYQGHIINYDLKGLSKSPVMTMPNGETYFIYEIGADGQQNVKLNTIGELMIFISKYGWKLVSSNSMPYAGDNGNTSKSVILNTNQYTQTLFFERPYTSKME